MKSNDIRQSFLNYFKSKGHEIVPSSSLVPGNDPTLLFTNAGMVQFKDLFLGSEVRSYTRAVSSQRCVRAGGKHNDLENVGYTARHHTFFEMLGNFSFGDYFKEDAIRYAWEFLTESLQLPREKLWVTVFQDDDEAAEIWTSKIGVPADRVVRLGEKSNFWQMGDTGPCGPCSEIFYDHGPEVAGGPPGSPDEDGDRYIEIWNLVFMQFDRQPSGELVPLPKPSVDTGMGLERLAAVLQHVHSNYEIDLFQNLLKAAAEITGVADTTNTSLRVIADHIRSCAFLVLDGVTPSNEGRGYVLRRIIRRAVRHGYQLGVKDVFFYRLVAALVTEMGEAYPALKKDQARVERVLREEEQQFARTLENGMQILEQAISQLKGEVLPGDTVFRLYDTYGFPVDLTADVAREHNLTLDMAGFEQAMEGQRQQARAASQFNAVEKLSIEGAAATEFVGYDTLREDARVLAIYQDGKAVQNLIGNTEAVVLLDISPFYGESGGQAGDRGALEVRQNGAISALFDVQDTQKQGEHVLHKGTLRQGRLSVGDSLTAAVEEQNRHATMLNHSATHLLHAALRTVLGEHVTQKGSLVTADRLRFDFSHNSPLTAEEVSKIERLVNVEILRNEPVHKEVMSMDQAMEKGALALFGEKYGDKVRVVTMGDFSTELCGGTHVDRTGDIGLFKLVAESGIAAGVRRVEAVTGLGALQYVEREEQVLRQVCETLRSSADGVAERVQQVVANLRSTEKELEQLKGKLASAAGSDIASSAVEVNGIKVLAQQVEGFDSKALRETVDKLKNKLGSAVVVLGCADGGKVALVAGVTQDLTDRIKAGDIVNSVAQQVGGKGGGRADMAMAGGSDAAALPAALASVIETVKQIT
ncbi:alanine--tRNA ligase [Pseudohongiella sp. SYSU M77423]|uniref:alanine--tRNA ligase n=1 Tax=Pseudohongiella sp. SYSU M77423 TaxID=3042312 RepID=UPI000C8B4489|nr:alanine--tRNA ligase [Pseudohongiella sp. SYSU M77423]MAY54510.1 alanine--tRNA ligase [Gammaproteobacteria bacterium]MDH7943490.1 alanine--tRNA ligase [Pseudohongiella sp. SYSU M77423]